MPVMCLPLPPARPVSTDMFSDCERVRFTSREAMEVYVSTRAEVFAAACGGASARHMAGSRWICARWICSCTRWRARPARLASEVTSPAAG